MADSQVNNRRGGLFLNIITSGTFLDRGIEERVRLIFTNSVILLGVIILGAFTYINYANGRPTAAIVVGGVFLLSVAMFLLLRYTKKTGVPSIVCTTELTFLFLYMTYTGGDSLSGVLWVFALPLVAVFMNGFFVGLGYITALLLGFSLILFVPQLNYAHYAPFFSARVAGVYALVCIFTLVYEYTKNLKDRQLAEKQKTIEQKNEEIELMKDSLDDGILLVDRNLIIQSEYSKSLEELFLGHRLAGLHFVDFLAQFLSPEKSEELRQHMPLVFARGNDSIVKTLNPLETERFDFDAGGRVEQKYLSFKFSKVMHESTELALITIADVTQRVELEHKIARQAEARATEVEQLLSIIKIGAPGMVLDFVADAQDSIALINQLLKSDLSPIETLNRMFGLVHAIKGDAAQLGMANLAKRFHELENKLSALRGQGRLEKEDFITIVVDMNEALDEIEKVREMLDNIREMQSAESELTHKKILVDSLLRVIRAASGRNGTDVVLKINSASMDEHLVGGSHRKVIKDVLIQLVRNSMSHGIESPEERLGKGKEAKASIAIVVKQEGEDLLLLYKDDGRGIDTQAVRDKARAMGLRPEAELEALGERDVCALIFEAGLSTASETDELAGRGIGMNLVKSEIEGAGGSILVESEPSRGCRFSIRMPLGTAKALNPVAE